MAYKFFDTLLDTSSSARRTGRKLTLPVSIGIHMCVLAGVLVVPMLTFDELPEPVMTGAIRAFLVDAAAPPPPPPPPPAAAAPRPVTAPKVEQPKPVVEEPKFTAPVQVPKELPREEPAFSGLGAGEPGGEAGGVEGGVKGGTEGGVVGGTLGGVPGGELGGVVGGVIGAIPKEEPKAPSGPVRVGGQIKAPAKVNNVAPVYPPVARQARVEGTVILEATISPQGRVTNAKVLRGIPLLDAAALAAVRQWVYSPTMLNGVPVPVVMTVTVNFRLGGGSSSVATAPAAKQAAPVAAPKAPPAEAPATPAETVPPPPPSH
jgi:protein TonB